MRYAPEHNDVIHEKIVTAASRLFRKHGVDGVGLAKIMSEADLTVGTFYTHFDSKEALLQEMLEQALVARHRELLAAENAEGGLELAVRSYLSRTHCDGVATGCPVSAIGAEVARHPRATRSTLMKHLEPSIELLARLLTQERGAPVGEAEAMAFFGLLTGTLQLARAATDRAKSDAILEAGVAAALRLARG